MAQVGSLQEDVANVGHTHFEVGTAADPLLDTISRQAAALYKAPQAFVTLSDGERLHFCGSAGVRDGVLPEDAVFCHFTLAQDVPLVVPDARLDPRFADHPIVVGPPHIRFYAGVPVLHPDGRRIGTVCIVDTVPRIPPPTDLHFLSRLAARVTNRLWERAAAAEPDRFLID